MSRHQRLINLASKVAAQERIHPVGFFLGAVVAHGNRPIAFGMNTTKTNPNNPKLSESYPNNVCAEVNAVQSALKFISRSDLANCDVYVTRLKNNFKSFGNSKPCSVCQRYLKDLGIKNVYYIEVRGKQCQIKKMKL